MAWLGTKVEPPPLEAGAEAFVLWLVREHFGCRKAHLDDAVDQDLDIVGDDGDEFVLLLVSRYGEWVRFWPWERYLCFDEGVPLMAPWLALSNFLRLPWRSTAFPHKPSLDRLTLLHIAFVLERGEWVDP
jgi:hypothetical protein